MMPYWVVARWNPQKGHKNLFKARYLLKTKNQIKWKCILIGSDMEYSNIITD